MLFLIFLLYLLITIPSEGIQLSLCHCLGADLIEQEEGKNKVKDILFHLPMP